MHKYNIFPIEFESGGKYLYAPLVGIVAETTQDEIQEYEKQLMANIVPSDLKELIGENCFPDELLPDTTPDLTILINQRCNFACKYCYSANGRSNAEFQESLFEPLVDWFVNPDKRGLHLNITFSGGGDPTLSMSKVRLLVGMMRKKGKDTGAEISFGMVCNGTRINKDDVEFIQDNFDNLVISFDVIPEVHDAQRSHYSVVAETMQSLVKSGVKFGLRSTITELNVERMEEMVTILHRDFPECRSIAMEAVLAPDMWVDSSQLELFYSRFSHNFFKAQKLADYLGISLGNTVELSADVIKPRACVGKFVVTPEGKLTACSRIATSGDKYFQDFVFGQITDSGVIYDVNKYNHIMQYRADNNEECERCFAKYHCGGGCMLARLSYSSEQMKIHCDFIRQILKYKIFDELD